MAIRFLPVRTLVLLLFAGLVAAEDGGDWARAVAQTHAPAVVTARITREGGGPMTRIRRVIVLNGERVEDAGGGPEVIEVPAALVDGAGIVVFGTAPLDPAARLRLLAGVEAKLHFGGEAPKITSVELALADGAVLPADLLLRDDRLGLAVARVRTTPAQPLAALSAAEDAAVATLDEVVVLGRYGRALAQAGRAVLGRIQSVVTTPVAGWTVALPVDEGLNAGPVFDREGRLVGLALETTPDGKDRTGEVWVVPAPTLRDLVERAKTAPAPAPAAPTAPAEDAGDLGF